MKLIVCVDERMGMAFGGRRQSRDRAVVSDIAVLTAGECIAMDARSETLFAETDVRISADAQTVFLEFAPPSMLDIRPHRIILYHWNRHYPADVYFDLPLTGARCIECIEFAGNSHEKITREIYEYEE